MGEMALAAWIALGFCVLALVAGVTTAAVRGLRAFRTLRSFTRGVGTAVDGVLTTAEAAERHAVALSEGGERLTVATERLQESLRRLAVLRAALADAQAPVTRLRGAVPRK